MPKQLGCKVISDEDGEVAELPGPGSRPGGHQNSAGALQIAGLGTVNEVPAGSCFGERTLIGIAKEANATVRVFTPFALVLAIARRSLHLGPSRSTLLRRSTLTPHRVAASRAARCGAGAKPKLRRRSVSHSARSASRSLSHGQTVVVEGCVEQDPCMFVLSGGIVVAERDGCAIARISPGATFGELRRVCRSQERAVTIRAADCISTPSACDHAERLGPSAWAAVLLYTLHCYPTHQLLRRRPNHGLRCIVYPPCREERYNPCHYEFKPVLMPVENCPHAVPLAGSPPGAPWDRDL
ncbi:SKOR [Symbiodinium sp. CCMP2592]|nr:SKOR [Symbiodinium sp. CCMP2592]